MVRPPKGSGDQRVTNGDRLLSFSECTEQQEAMLLDFPYGYVAWALTTLFLRLSGHFNTDYNEPNAIFSGTAWNERELFGGVD